MRFAAFFLCASIARHYDARPESRHRERSRRDSTAIIVDAQAPRGNALCTLTIRMATLFGNAAAETLEVAAGRPERRQVCLSPSRRAWNGPTRYSISRQSWRGSSPAPRTRANSSTDSSSASSAMPKMGAGTPSSKRCSIRGIAGTASRRRSACTRSRARTRTRPSRNPCPTTWARLNRWHARAKPGRASSDGCSRTAPAWRRSRGCRRLHVQSSPKTSRRGLRRLVIGLSGGRARILARRRGLVAPGGDFFPEK